MNEIGPGVHHWKAVHPRIQVEVSSYYVEPAATLIDPLLPPEGIDWFRSRTAPQRIVLTNRHHYRQSDRLQAEFGCPVLASEPGLHEFDDGRAVEGFAFGDELAEGITAYEVGAICPDEVALHVEIGEGFLAVADGIINYGELAFVSDNLIGDDPEAVKEGLRNAYRRLCELDFDGLMCAHGDPMPGGGREALREFVGWRLQPGSS
jgi:hypothetical protein